MWIILLWKRYDFRDLAILLGQDGKPMVFSSEEAANSYMEAPIGLSGESPAVWPFKMKSVRMD